MSGAMLAKMSLVLSLSADVGKALHGIDFVGALCC